MGKLLVIDKASMKNTWQDLLSVRPFGSAVHDEDFTVDDSPFSPSIVLIDIDAYPAVATGIGVVEDLRTEFPDARIIVLMADPMTSAQRAYEAGASACLPKPLDYAVVLKLLDLMVRSEGKQPAADGKRSTPVKSRVKLLRPSPAPVPNQFTVLS